MTAMAAMNFPAHVLWEDAVEGVDEGEPVLIRVWWATGPSPQRLTTTYKMALAAVPIIEARRTLRRGSRTRLAVTAPLDTDEGEEGHAGRDAMPL